MWAISAVISNFWQSLFDNRASGGVMRAIGIIILAAGLLLGAYAIQMDVGVEVPAQDYGHGISTPSMQVANIDRMAQRQNYLIFSGVLAVVGAILTGFGSLRQISQQLPTRSAAGLIEKTIEVEQAQPISVTICPKCRHMGDGNDIQCSRCGEPVGSHSA